MTKISWLLPSIFLTIAAALTTLFYLLKQEDKSFSFKYFILYSLATIVLYMVVAFEFLLVKSFDVTFVFYLSQISVLAVGVCNVLFLESTSDHKAQNLLLKQSILTLYSIFLGAAVYYFTFCFLDTTGYVFIFAKVILVYPVPFLFYKSFEAVLSVPEKEYKKWYFPVGKKIEVDNHDFSDEKVTLFAFEIQRTVKDADDIVQTRAKAPLNMDWGQYYSIVIVLWADTNPERTIEVSDKFRVPYGWNFYVKPQKWYSRKRYINPELTIRENDIRGKDIVVAERFLN